MGWLKLRKIQVKRTAIVLFVVNTIVFLLDIALQEYCDKFKLALSNFFGWNLWFGFLENDYFQEILRHIWPEIYIALLIYYFLEDGLNRIFDIPSDRNQANTEDIIKEIRKSKNQPILILDTSIQNYFEVKNNAFKNAIAYVLENGDSKINILLLHPDTYAAHQRNEDLERKGDKDFEKQMRSGIRNLYNLMVSLKADFVEKEKAWDDNRINVKLFKATPSMTFACSEDIGFFSLLPPFEYDSKAKKVTTSMSTSFGEFLQKRFYELWEKNDANEDDGRVINFSDFTHCELSLADSSSAKISNIAWGGYDYERFLPRYIMFSNSDTSGKDFHVLLNAIEKNDFVVLTHCRKEFYVKLKNIQTFTLDENSKGYSEYNFRLQKIKRTYGWNEPKDFKEYGFGSIYWVQYSRDWLRITTEKDIVAEKIKKDNVGYYFLSHKQLDIDISDKFLNSWRLLKDNFEDLKIDPKDKEFITGDLSKKFAPRFRAIAIFHVNRIKGRTEVSCLRKGDIEIKDAELEQLDKLDGGIFENKYIGNFKYHIEGGTDHEFNAKEISHLAEIAKNSKNFLALKKFLDSVIAFDIENILGNWDQKQPDSKWKVSQIF